MVRFKVACVVALFGAVGCAEAPGRHGDSGEVGVSELGLTKAQDPNAEGDTNFCSDPIAPCDSGEGDCDHNGECSGALVCGTDNGSNFGHGAIWDVCVPSHCINGGLDAAMGETGTDCGGPCGYCLNGAAADLCSAPNPACSSGESDCDSDAECAGALVCGRDNGFAFGLDSSWDVCVPAHCTNGSEDGGDGETGVDCGGACGICTPPSCPPAGQSPGDTAYCSSDCPCDTGNGDCDSNLECAGMLICGTDIGSKFGLGAIWDVCVPAHCINGSEDGGDGETGVDCGGECGTCPPLVCPPEGLSPGDADFCTVDCPCDGGNGDCDADLECFGPLVCGADIGDHFGLAANYDICVLDTCLNGSLDEGETDIDCGGPDCGTCDPVVCPPAGQSPGDPAYCSEDCPCDTGNGDCDSNLECAGELICGSNVGAKFGMADHWDICVPSHCTNGSEDGGSGETGVDCGGDCGACPPIVCPPEGLSPNDPAFCTEDCPCDSGVGDCDSDQECGEALICGHNVGARFDLPRHWDICVPSLCTNGVLDQGIGETGVDCGGEECGLCICATGTSPSSSGCDGTCGATDEVDSADCDTACDHNDAASGPDCDAVCDTGDAPGSPDCQGTCDAGDAAGSADCDTVCDSEDEAGSPDCEGSCDPGDPPGTADCNGDCDPGDGAGSADCTGTCDLGDTSGSPDCDGYCDILDTLGSEDCNGVCDIGDISGSPDCNGICDQADDPSSEDCIICEFSIDPCFPD